MRRWHRGYELRLVPGAHECDKELTSKILRILKKEFHLKGAQILPTYPKNPEDDQHRPYSKKAHVLGQFEEREEVREDIGEDTFSDFIGRDSVYFITFPFNKKDGVQVATTKEQMRYFGRLLKGGNAKVKQLTLVAPVGPDDLKHSAKRKRRLGLIEVDGLKMFLEDIARENYKEIITIGSHSDKTKEIAQDLGMRYRDIDPFRPESIVSTPRLGPFLYKTADNTQKRKDYNEQMAKMTPFISWIKKNYKDRIPDIYFIAPDDGSEKTLEQIAYACRGDKQNLLAILKDRVGPSRVKIHGIKSSSTARLSDIKEKICILADDRRLSGNTTNEIAYALKNDHNAGEVVALLAHDLSYDENIRGHTSVDRFVFLETNPGSVIAQIKDEPRIERLPMEITARLLAAEIFDSYVYMRDRGEIKVR